MALIQSPRAGRAAARASWAPPAGNAHDQCAHASACIVRVYNLNLNNFRHFIFLNTIEKEIEQPNRAKTPRAVTAYSMYVQLLVVYCIMYVYTYMLRTCVPAIICYVQYIGGHADERQPATKLNSGQVCARFYHGSPECTA